jgi:hypothetical protein
LVRLSSDYSLICQNIYGVRAGGVALRFRFDEGNLAYLLILAFARVSSGGGGGVGGGDNTSSFASQIPKACLLLLLLPIFAFFISTRKREKAEMKKKETRKLDKHPKTYFLFKFMSKNEHSVLSAMASLYLNTA